MLARREGELWEERVGYSFDEMSLSSCMIFNCLSAKKNKKNDPEPHLTVAAVFIQIVSETWSASTAWSAALTLNYA